MPAFDAELELLVERLAARCTHAPLPCEACTNLAVGAVESFESSGWHAQIRRYHNRPRKETP